MTVIKENLGPHSGEANNPLTFQEAYAQVEGAPDAAYTTGNGKAFQVRATFGQKGVHANEKVLKFMDGTTERARAYVDCWGHRTNCNSQHIDLYSEALTKIDSQDLVND